MSDDYIRREDAINALVEAGQRSKRYHVGEVWELNGSEIREAIYPLPSADVRPAVRGKWIWDDFGYHCSECYYHVYGNTGEVLTGEYKFCPHCGAEMEEEEEQ